MPFKRQKRGVSFGTTVMLSICLVTVLTGFVVFSRISGGIGRISIDPSILTEPLAFLAQSAEGPALPMADPQQTSNVFSALTAQPVNPTSTPAPTPPPNQVLTLTAVGQITLGSELQKSGTTAPGLFDFDPMLSPIASALSGSDLTIATLRTGLSSDAGSLSTYSAPAAIAESLKRAGVNVFNLATDRLLDGGVSGIATTRNILNTIGVSQAGAYLTLEERQLSPIVDIQGVKVGLLSYTESISAAGKKAATESEIAMSTRLFSADAATTDIASLRTRGANLVIVLLHAGSRTDAKPSRETKAAVDALVSAGADIILGTNPTTVQEIERRTVSDHNGDAREVFIAYSLGNFLIDDSRETGDITGLVLHLQIEWNAQSNRASIRDAWYMPTWIMRWKDASGVNRFRVVPAGSINIPENMTDSIYINMKKSYQRVVDRLGSSAARPRTE